MKAIEGMKRQKRVIKGNSRQKMIADYTDDKKTGRNGEKGSFEVTKLGR